MTYLAGSPIQATDYNSFATLPGGVKQVFSDISPGSVPSTLGVFNSSDMCTYGYGQATAMAPVSIGQAITAEQWASLFDAMRSSGTHQGTTVVPPVPTLNPVPGDVVIAQNSVRPLAEAISLLSSNRFNIALGQSALTTGTQFRSSAP